MKIKSSALVLVWAAAFVLYGASGRAEAGPSACVTCHTFLGGELARPVVEWSGSIHQQNGITCDLCHCGGSGVSLGDVRDPAGQAFADMMSRATSQAHGFIGKPSGKALFAVCARCHGQSVDRYAKSIMGKAYLDGKGGPSCVTCHQAHRNTMPEVPKGCESCHKDTAGVAQVGPEGWEHTNGDTASVESTKNAQSKINANTTARILYFPH